MPEEQGRTAEEALGPVEPKVMDERERSIRQRLDEAAAQARAVQAACSGDDPHLGLATTEELLEELHARMRTALAQPDKVMALYYRTIDGDGIDVNRAGEDPSREAQRG